MLKLKKLLYIPEMIHKLYESMRANYLLANYSANDLINDYGCNYGQKWHRIMANEMEEMLGPFAENYKINSLHKLFYIKRLINSIRQVRNHEIELIKEHISSHFDINSCRYNVEHHKAAVQSWNDILGIWA